MWASEERFFADWFPFDFPTSVAQIHENIYPMQSPKDICLKITPHTTSTWFIVCPFPCVHVSWHGVHQHDSLRFSFRLNHLIKAFWIKKSWCCHSYKEWREEKLVGMYCMREDSLFNQNKTKFNAVFIAVSLIMD